MSLYGFNASKNPPTLTGTDASTSSSLTVNDLTITDKIYFKSPTNLDTDNLAFNMSIDQSTNNLIINTPSQSSIDFVQGSISGQSTIFNINPTSLNYNVGSSLKTLTYAELDNVSGSTSNLQAQINAILPTTVSVSVGSTTTLSAGSSATVTNSGTSTAAVFNFGIPQGIQGSTGATGATGAKGDKGDPGEVTTAAMNTAIALSAASTLAAANLYTDGVAAGIEIEIAGLGTDITTLNGEVATLQTQTENQSAVTGITTFAGQVNTGTLDADYINVTTSIAGIGKLNLISTAGSNLIQAPSTTINSSAGFGAVYLGNYTDTVFISGLPLSFYFGQW